MKRAEPLITSGTGLFKAVCHRCQYVGFEPNTTKCVTCGFPLLLEPYQSGRLTLRDIFDRSAIELTGRDEPTPLPGVSRSQRQREQMLARAQKRLSHNYQVQPQLVDHTLAQQPAASVTVVAQEQVHTNLECAPSLAAARVVSRPFDIGDTGDNSDGPSLQASPYPAPYGAATMPNQQARSYFPMFVMFLVALVSTMAMAASGGL